MRENGRAGKELELELELELSSDIAGQLCLSIDEHTNYEDKTTGR